MSLEIPEWTLASPRRRVLRFSGAAALLAASAGSAQEAAPVDRLKILAPASPGGGWDQTAHAMQEALRASGLAKTVEVTNSPGAGGAIGLALFVSNEKGDGNALLVSGLVMISAIHATKATVSLLEATPIARLTGEALVVVVPAASDFKTIEDLTEALKAEPSHISWAGGSAGGTDQVLVGLIAKAAGVTSAINYIPFSGGGEAVPALLRNQVAAGVSGYSAFEPYIRSGQLRALALSAERRVPGIDTPTLKERGIDVALVKWRGVFAPPGISEEQRRRLIATTAAMVRTEAWQRILKRYHWDDLYLPGETFASFVKAEDAQARPGFDLTVGPPRSRPPLARSVGRRDVVLALTVSVIALALVFATVLRRQSEAGRRREHALSQDLESARQVAERSREEARHVLQGLGNEIDRQFGAWELTPAEREVALLMLKGLRHKEIANLRNTSERTVRQQALSIYDKAGVDGRRDLAAFFLQDLLLPAEPSAGERSA
jgi:putative tricarboxylic transport membrane protein